MNRTIAPSIIKTKTPELLKPYSLNSDFKNVFCFNNPGSQVIRIELNFQSGILYQNAPLSASFMGSMLTESSLKTPAKQLSEKIDYLGSTIQTETGNYNQCITVYCTTKVLNQTLELLTEIINEPAFNESDFDIMRNTAKQRYLVGQKKVETVSRQYFNAFLFGENSKLGHFTKINDYESLNTNDIKEHFNNHFKNGWHYAIIAGDIDNNALLALAQFFKTITHTKPLVKLPVNYSIEQSNKNKIELNGAVQSAIKIGFNAISKDHDDYAGLQLTNMILGGYFGSRLMNNIREDKGYTYGIGSNLIPMYKTGYLGISTEVGKNVCDAALKEIHFEINKLCNEKVAATEFELARNYLVGSFIRNSDGVFAMADRFSGVYEFDLEYTFYENYFNRLYALKPEDILEMANKYFNKPYIEITVG